jgi:hypothetical protein
LNLFRFFLAAILIAVAIPLVVLTYRWPLIGDAQLFHYSHFLIEHGFTPYRDIPDINMPGTYVLEGLAIRLFGGTDLAWRVYDFTLLGVLGAAMIVIARPYDWLAGLFAGVMFALLHVNHGPWNSVQRDEIMTVLIMVGCAFLFEGLRRRKPWLLFAFGLSLGMASTLKPTVAPVGLVLLVMAAWHLRKEHVAIAHYVEWGVGGAATAVAIAMAFLIKHHAFWDFIQRMRELLPLYTGMDRAIPWRLLRYALPWETWIILPFAMLAALAPVKWKGWERWAIVVCIAFGAFSYVAQGKGYSQHAYPLGATVLLWAGLELTDAMQSAKWTRPIGMAGIAAGILIAVPGYYRHIRIITPQNEYALSLESDLTHMGGDQLNRKIQCLDMIYGCYSALYHLGLIQSTGEMGDILLFAPQKSPMIDHYRDLFWDAMVANPPEVIVLSKEWFDRYPTFSKIQMWPKFANYLQENYRIAVARSFDSKGYVAYRIYLRNDVSLPLPQKGG